MNALVFATLGAFVLMWFFYLVALRRSRFAFFFWFPLTATAGLGTLAWLFAGLMLLGSARQIGGGDPESGGFAQLGAAIAFGLFLICPITFAISIWLRPIMEAYKAVFILPTLIIYILILTSFSKIGYLIENQTLSVTVMDAQSNPIKDVTISYETLDHHFGFAFSPPPLKGEVLTDKNGHAVLPVPKSHEIFCRLIKIGFSLSSFQMDRDWGSGVHQSNFTWNLPNNFVAGSVQIDIPDSKAMEVKLYLAHKDATEKLPYPPYNSTSMPKSK